MARNENPYNRARSVVVKAAASVGEEAARAAKTDPLLAMELLRLAALLNKRADDLGKQR